MISQSAVEAFVQTRVESYEWIKHAIRSDLITAVQKHTPMTIFHTKPHLHQLACFLIGIANPHFLFFLDMRLGKTKLMLDLFSYRKNRAKPGFRALVLVPRLLHLEPWRDQIPIHAPHLTTRILEGSSAVRMEDLAEGDADIYVINYAGLATMLSYKTTVITKTGIEKIELVPDREKLQWVAQQFKFIVLDESVAVKNHQSLIYKILSQMMPQIIFRYAMTGTPFGRTPHDFWAQFKLIDHGETLGRTLGIFHAAYFTTKKNFFGGYKHTFITAKEQDLKRRIQNKSIRYELEECLDVPPKVHVPVRVQWTGDARPYYDQIHAAYHMQAMAALERENNFVRLRQITAGFLRYKTPDGEEIDIEFTENPKLEGLESLLEDTPTARKFVVFHFFVKSGDMIGHRLQDLKIGHVRIWSQTKNRAELLTRFRTNPKCRVLVVNESIGAMALDLQAANYIVFYDLPVSPITREQAEARCRGPAQQRTSYIHDLVMIGSVDEKILAFLREGRDLRQAILAGVEPL